MIQERVKANFEPPHAQKSALIEIMERLFRRNSAKEFTTTSTANTDFNPNHFWLQHSEHLDSDQ